MKRRMHLGGKIAFGFLMIFLLTVFVAVVGQRSMVTTLERMEKLDDVRALSECLLEARRHEKNYIIRGEFSYIEKVKESCGQFRNKVSEIRNKFVDPVNLRQMDELLAGIQSYERRFLDFVDAVNAATQSRIEAARAAETGT